MRWLLFGLIIVLAMVSLSFLSISNLSGNISDVQFEQKEEPVEEVKEEPKTEKPSSIVLEIDLCENIICEDSERTCPDGFLASCQNSCSKGVCPSCEPDCSGHDIVEIVVEPQTQNQNTENMQENQSQNEQQNQPQKPKITNIKYDADGDDRKKENWNTEWVEIEGQGDITGWTLSDEADHVFTFPSFVMSGKVLIHSGDGENNQTDLFWNGGKRPIWNNDGDKATLRDKDGNLVDEYSYG